MDVHRQEYSAFRIMRAIITSVFAPVAPPAWQDGQVRGLVCDLVFGSEVRWVTYLQYNVYSEHP